MTVMDLPQTRMTPEELLELPDSSTMELVDGQIEEKNVSKESSRIELLFSFQFQTYLMLHRGQSHLPQVHPATTFKR